MSISDPFFIFATSTVITFLLYIRIFKDLRYFLRNYVRFTSGPQTIHRGKVSRLGGLVIFLTLALMSIIKFKDINNIFFWYLLISIPVFFVAFIEDLTQSVSPKYRLIGTIFSSILFIIIYDVLITKLGWKFFDYLLDYKLISLVFTILCITFLTQAFNIIDGLNGLSLITAILCFACIAIISNENGDYEIQKNIIFLISVLLGVLIFNFPFGKIFLGDSGAYLIGLFLSVTTILSYNKLQNLSTFVVISILIYPVYELTRSIFRRIILRKKVFSPDTKHLHSILYAYNFNKYSLNPLITNIISSLQIIGILFLNSLYIILNYKNDYLIIVGILIFILIYEIVYFKIKLGLNSLK